MRTLLQRNLVYKLLSLAMAILLYVIASAQRTPAPALEAEASARVFVQPEVRGLEPDMLVTVAPKGGYVHVSGSAAAIARVRAQGTVSALVDVAGVKPGTQRLPMQYELPPNIQWVGPTMTAVTLERKVRRSFEVGLPPIQPPPWYRFDDPRISPDQVTVTGAESVVRQVRRVVANIPGASASGAVDETVGLLAQDAERQAIEGVTIQPSRVRVQIRLLIAEATKSVLISPQVRGQPAEGYELTDYRVEPRMLTVVGSQERLAGLSALTADVSAEGITGNTTRRVTLTVPEGIKVQGSASVQVTLFVRRLRPSAGPVTSGPDTGGDPGAGGTTTPPPTGTTP